MAQEGTMGTPPADDQQESSETLTPDEKAELEKYRETERRQAELSRKEAERNAPPVTHRLFLADGSSVESAGTMTVYNGQQVINAVPLS